MGVRWMGIAVVLMLGACGEEAPTGPDAAVTKDTGSATDLALGEIAADTQGAASDAAGDATQDVAAVPDSVADSPALADAVSTTDAGCSKGQLICIGPATAALCNENGTFDDIPCGEFATCSNGKCKIQICAAGKSSCDGTKISACTATGTAATVVQDCADKQLLCEGAKCLPKLCEGGSKHCDGETATICSPGGTAWLKIADCAASNAACKLGNCAAIPCAPGGFGCENDNVVQCAGTTWTAVQDCKTESKVCAAGKCQKTLCNVGEFDCVGGNYVTCEAPGLDWTYPVPCPGTTKCAPGIGCLPGAAICQADDTGCDGSQPVDCDTTGKATVLGEDCTKTNQVCTGGSCKPKLCQPAELSCQNNSAVACNDAGSDWLPVDKCGAKVCDKGGCVAKVCGQGQTLCAGGQLAVCAATWQPTACPVDQVCSQGQCTLASCKLEAPTGSVLTIQSLPFANLAQACDLNDDKKPDAKLGALAQLTQAGASAQAALGLVRVLELAGWPNATTVALLPAAVTPEQAWSKCPGPDCALSVLADAYDVQATLPICPARSLLQGVVYDPGSGKLTGGGVGSLIYVPLQVGVLGVEIPIFGAKLQGQLVEVAGAPSTFEGVLCGAVSQESLFTALQNLPDAAFAGLPTGKAQFAKLLTQLVPPDLDLDGDGKPESVSAAFVVKAGLGKSLGLAK